MKLDRSEKRALIIFGSVLGVLLILLVFTIIRWRIDNTQEMECVISVGDRMGAGEDGNNVKKDVYVVMEKTKQWPSQAEDGSSSVGAEYDGRIYYGFGANTDIVTASVEAYIDCINKFK